MELTIRPERQEDRLQVRELEARSFGPGRFARTAYRVREGATSPSCFAFVAVCDEVLVGSIRFTEILAGGRGGALFLGPLVVAPEKKGHGIGGSLIQHGLGAARSSDVALILLVGDLDYFQKSGFQRVPVGQIALPGPVDPLRLLALEISGGALQDYRGTVTPV